MSILVDSLYQYRPARRTMARTDERLGASHADRDIFNSWAELEAFAIKKLELSSAAVCLLPDFVGADTPGDLGSLSVSLLDSRSVLVETIVGYRSRLVFHLERSKEGGTRTPWPPKDLYGFLASSALEVYSRNVSDRVVELMADKSGHRIAWLYLDEQGRVESTSSGAVEFCRRLSPGRASDDGYFPIGISRYIAELVSRFLTLRADSEPESVSFAISGADGMVNCLLRRMAGEGYLLSLWQES